jgi:hypothetical protein
MTWGDLFDRAESVETTVGEIHETLTRRREGDDGG